MARVSKEPLEIVNELFTKSIQNGDCLECHLRPSIDRGGRERHYVMVGGRAGKRVRASRLVWEVMKGPITDNLWILHTCDNTKCINPDHLFLGTPQDNTDDMIAKGRKVDDPEVGLRRRLATAKIILSLRARGYSDDRIANECGISKSTLRNYDTGPYKDTFRILAGNADQVRVGRDDDRIA